MAERMIEKTNFMYYFQQTCYKVIPVGDDVRLSYGAAPFWDKETQSWYAVDYLAADNQTFCRFDYWEQRLYRANIENTPIGASFILPMKPSNYYAAGSGKSILVIYWDGRSPYVTLVKNGSYFETDPIYANNSVDVATTDPFGRLTVATYRSVACLEKPDVDSNVYSFRKNGDILQIISNIKSFGGFAWNRKKKAVYFFDSCDYKLREYKWDKKTGLLSK